MANEIQFTASLGFLKPSIMVAPDGLSITGLVANMNGPYYTKDSILVGTAATLLNLGQVTQPHYAAFYNNVNYATVPAAVTITGATNNGSGLVRITSPGHGLVTGDVVTVTGVGGTVEANGTWAVTVINSSTFDLLTVVFVNAYTTGGTVTLIPSLQILNGASGSIMLQLFVGEWCFPVLPPSAIPYVKCNPTGQILQHMVLSY
jgi:hypothetical protein